jgi:hypothetical protein
MGLYHKERREYREGQRPTSFFRSDMSKKRGKRRTCGKARNLCFLFVYLIVHAAKEHTIENVSQKKNHIFAPFMLNNANSI